MSGFQVGDPVRITDAPGRGLIGTYAGDLGDGFHQVELLPQMISGTDVAVLHALATVRLGSLVPADPGVGS